jgi:hypothetical protein
MRLEAATMAQSDRNKQGEAGTPPPRRGRSAPVADDSSGLAASAFSRKGFTDPTLVLRWSEIVGPEVARIALPVRLQDGPSGGTLTLKAEPGAAVFLQHETPALCDRINTYLGRPAVAKLRFLQAPLAKRPAARALRRPARPSASDPATALNGAPALREALLSLSRWRSED